MISAARRALPAFPVLLLLAGCWPGDDTVRVTAPSPTGDAARSCRELANALPRRVEGQERRTLSQDTPYAAAWGDPAIVLRCGVNRPAVLTPGSESYDPTADAVEVNGVSWVMEEQSDGIRFTTNELALYVEVTVPDDYAPEVNPLVDLAKAIRTHVPADALHSS